MNAARKPARIGYRMPAEWHPHKATWLSYPTNEETFPRLDEVRRAFHHMMRALAPREEVHLLIDEPGAEERVREALGDEVPRERLACHVVPTVDSWIRDYGPNFLVKNGQAAYNDWIFNAWGGKYQDLAQDNSVPSRLEAILKLPRFEPGIVMEGGSIEVDGRGTCLTTEQCLLNPNRNPDLSREDIERYLADYLGAPDVLWLGEGIVGDDTDGHIDDVARFAAPGVIVSACEEDPEDANCEILKDNLERLEAARTPQGQRYRVVRLPMPHPLESGGERLPASYANFYIANGAVLMPAFNDPRDRQAAGILQGLFPDRRVHAIDCREMVKGLGAVHCVTQQEPAPPGSDAGC